MSNRRYHSWYKSAILTLSFFGLLQLASCKSEVIYAKSCYVVEVGVHKTLIGDFGHGRQLVPYFDRFAVAQGFILPSGESSGGEYIYRNPKEGAQIALALGMGERRAVSTLYTNQGKASRIVQSFETYMLESIGADFGVLPCKSIDGFQIPVLYGVDLNEDDT